MKIQLISQETLLIEPGYRQVYAPPPDPETDPVVTTDQSRLADLKEGQRVRPRTVTITRRVPPKGVSEADLIRLLQAQGIGRPATYASIIENLVVRRYVGRSPDGTLSPTNRGREVCQFLTREYSNLFDPTFTAQMEHQLDLIAAGEARYVDALQALLLKL